MSLIDKQWMNRIPRQPDDLEDPMLVGRFFSPVGSATWYVVSGFKDEKKLSRYEKDFICYGYVTLDGDTWEWGSFSIRELEAIRLMGGLRIERDEWFEPRRFSEAFAQT